MCIYIYVYTYIYVYIHIYIYISTYIQIYPRSTKIYNINTKYQAAVGALGLGWAGCRLVFCIYIYFYLHLGCIWIYPLWIYAFGGPDSWLDIGLLEP